MIARPIAGNSIPQWRLPGGNSARIPNIISGKRPNRRDFLKALGAGAEAPERLEGRSQAPVLRGEVDSVRETIFLAYVNLHRAVPQGRWKLHRYPHVDKTLLFDLEADPHETRDLAGDPAHADRVKTQRHGLVPHFLQ
jgi:arylsulfatase A-like enzyme